MTPELEAEYAAACVPFIDGAITEACTKLKNWRVFLEVNSLCQLRCASCTKGNQAPVNGLKYEHQTGLMDMDLMERILDKIKSENPEAIVFLYGNSEPFLHPRLPECITAIKSRGLHPEMSTNLNYVQRLDETLEAGPEFIIISMSGFTQEVYERGHGGGKIEKVKENMRLFSEANSRVANKVKIACNFHVYQYNEHEIAPMKEYATSLGLGFFTSLARAISMENTIQFCREKDPDATPFEMQDGRPDWNQVLPPVSQQWRDIMDQLRIPPTKAREMYRQIPVSRVCPVGAGSLFTFIRHDGLVQMCACTADRRITLGNYLDMTPDQMIEKRTGHSICKQCLSYRLPLYYMLANRKAWESPT